MEEILRLKQSNCKNCHKCIRYCPVKAIRFSAGQAHVVENECILCGMCFSVCPQNAKLISSDMEKVRVMLSAEAVYASVAPSFAASFPGVGIDALERALVKLGFRGAEETAVGAAVVTKEYERILREEKPNVLISSCCTSVDLLMQKHYPDTLFALAPVMTPAQAHGALIKQKYPGAKVVFIGPCIAKKQEAVDGEQLDAVLSFEELHQWLEAERVTPEQGTDTRAGGKTRQYPTAGGVLNSMEKDPDYTYIAVDGIKKCAAVLEEIRSGALHRCFIELSACQGSCAGGPLLGRPMSGPVQNTAHILHYTAQDDFAVEPYEKNTYRREFEPIERIAKQPSQQLIDQMLVRMGKQDPETQLNCGSCGYNSCRDKAVAIIQGKADLSMCLPYMMEKAQGFSDAVVNNSLNAILVLNEDLEVQKINPVACRLFRVRDEKDVLGDTVDRLMDDAVFRKVRQTRRNRTNEREYLSEYGCYVDRTVLFNGDSRLFICMMRDVTDEVERLEKKMETRLQAVAIADDVAKKQLKIVQDIASLLGETAADTLIAIDRLKETISDD